MKTRRTFSAVLALLLISSVVATTGCSDARPAEVQKRRDNLAELANTYVAFSESKGSSPTNVTDFLAFIDSQPSSDALVAAKSVLEEGDVVMIWGGDLSDEQANSSYVLAFEARAPASGGYVVMADGSVQLMTGKDFSEATMLPPSP
ncbi:MAG: hypothetical protein ACR2NZ_17775 [Rubripirellula sp.]